MTEIFIYLIKAAVINAIILAFYYFAIKKTNKFALMRITLVLALTLPLILPLLLYSFNETETNKSRLPTLVITLNETALAKSPDASQKSLNWQVISKTLYYSVTLLLISGLIISIASILRKRIRSVQYTTSYGRIEVEKTVKSPFSFFSWVFIAPMDLKHPQLDMILKHEFSHVKEKHSIDRMLAGISRSILWFSPLVHYTSQLLSEVHEYQADSKVIGTYTRREYSDLILSFYMNPHSFGISNNFSLHIKKRIIMINNLKSGKFSIAKFAMGLLLVTSAITATSLVTTSNGQTFTTDNLATILSDENSIVSNISPTLKASSDLSASVNEEQPDNQPVSGNPDTSKTKPTNRNHNSLPDSPAQFPGGDEARNSYFITNIVYPKDAREKGIEGTVFVQFIIESTGKITNAKVIKGIYPSIDKVALDIVSKMPDWIPAKKNNKPVNFEMTIPIKFSLSKDDPAKDANQEVKSDINKDSKEAKRMQEGTDVFIQVDVMPEYPGGDQARAEYFNTNINFTEEAIKKGTEGTVYISFVVEADGSITGPKILRGIGSGLDEIALNAVKNMPKWKPGMVKGKNVAVQFNIPVKFKLTKSDKK